MRPPSSSSSLSSSSTDVEQYSLLPTHEVGSAEEAYKHHEGSEAITNDDKASVRIQLCALWAILLAVLSMLFPITRSSIVLSNPGVHPQLVFSSRADRLAFSSSLPRPNPYIGLDRLNASISLAALPRALPVFPHIFSPVSRAEPHKVYPTDGRARRTFNGVVSPGEPHIIINKNVSMIMQVRVQDYNLGRCAISALLPFASSQELAEQNRTLILGSSAFTLDIWSLDADIELDLPNLSWLTRPPRKSLLSRMDVREGRESRTTEWDCGVVGALKTYEIACPINSGDECCLDFWQEQPEVIPRTAIVIVQTPSI